MTRIPAQLDLFPTGRPQVRRRPTIRPHFADDVDGPRLAGQNANLLARLLRGPVTNAELWQNPELFGRAINSRVADVRAFLKTAGETIESTRLPAGPATGAATWRYRIMPNESPPPRPADDGRGRP